MPYIERLFGERLFGLMRLDLFDAFDLRVVYDKASDRSRSAPR